MCREVGAASGRGLLAASLFLDLQRCLYSPRTLPELRGLGPRPPGPVHSTSVSPRKFGVGSSDCPRGFPEVLSQQAGTGSALRRHRPAKTRAQQQDTKDPQLWRTNLLPRAGPACPACGGANPRLKPWVPTQQGAPSAWRRGVLHPHPHLEVSPPGHGNRSPPSLVQPAEIAPAWGRRGGRRAQRKGTWELLNDHLFFCPPLLS